MSDQHVTDQQSASIMHPSKPKTLGQVGYEAMLSLGTQPDDLLWHNQPRHIRAAWEMVALAITKRIVDDIRRSLGVKL